MKTAGLLIDESQAPVPVFDSAKLHAAAAAARMVENSATMSA